MDKNTYLAIAESKTINIESKTINMGLNDRIRYVVKKHNLCGANGKPMTIKRFKEILEGIDEKIYSRKRNKNTQVNCSSEIRYINRKRKLNQFLNMHVYYVFPIKGNNLSVVAQYGDGDIVRGTYTHWVKYGRHSYPRKSVKISFFVQHNYITSVVKRKLAVIDGIFNTHIEKIKTIQNMEIYRATWLKKGQGYNFTKQSGYIAKAGDQAYHGKTERSAIQGLKNKIIKQKIKTIKFNLSNYLDVLVNFNDSLMAGNCKAGTENWINQHLDGRTSATVRELLNIGSSDSMVIAACNVAVKRFLHRQAKKEELIFF